MLCTTTKKQKAHFAFLRFKERGFSGILGHIPLLCARLSSFLRFCFVNRKVGFDATETVQEIFHLVMVHTKYTEIEISTMML